MKKNKKKRNVLIEYSFINFGLKTRYKKHIISTTGDSKIVSSTEIVPEEGSQEITILSL
jgi:hypothetical protein